MSVSLVLLNDTLRWHDNPLLAFANALPSPEQKKVALVVLDKAAFFGRQYGLQRANLHRLQQQLSLIAGLRSGLTSQNIGLITLVGNTARCVKVLSQQLSATELICAEPVAPNEFKAIQQLALSLKVTQLDCNSLLGETLRPDLSQLPHSFTPFRKQREPLLLVSAPITTTAGRDWFTTGQTAAYNTDFAALEQQFQPQSVVMAASENSALARVQHFIWQSKHILHYKDTRNQLLGENYACFLSTPLAAGSLSVRQLWQEITDFEQQVSANESTYWLKFELLWREFFRWQMRKHTNRWFSKGAVKGALDFTAPKLSRTQQAAFMRWCQANTGIDFVDANMRLLNQTGLMSNRGRQNVASYLIHDLAIDWRLGAAYFEQRLLDYDCASNWGNWAYIAGTGNSNERQFNIPKQARLYDADGSFVKAMLLQAKP